MAYITDLLGKICIPLIIGYITLIIAKKQIINSGITQFRQKWIDNLRDSISIYIAKAEMISMIALDDDKSYFEYFKELSQMQYKIELMLNSSEDDHNEIINIIKDIRNLIHDENINEDKLSNKFDKKILKLTEVSKQVLKREWNVVKKGK